MNYAIFKTKCCDGAKHSYLTVRMPVGTRVGYVGKQTYNSLNEAYKEFEDYHSTTTIICGCEGEVREDTDVQL